MALQEVLCAVDWAGFFGWLSVIAAALAGVASLRYGQISSIYKAHYEQWEFHRIGWETRTGTTFWANAEYDPRVWSSVFQPVNLATGETPAPKYELRRQSVELSKFGLHITRTPAFQSLRLVLGIRPSQVKSGEFLLPESYRMPLPDLTDYSLKSLRGANLRAAANALVAHGMGRFDELMDKGDDGEIELNLITNGGRLLGTLHAAWYWRRVLILWWIASAIGGVLALLIILYRGFSLGCLI